MGGGERRGLTWCASRLLGARQRARVAVVQHSSRYTIMSGRHRRPSPVSRSSLVRARHRIRWVGHRICTTRHATCEALFTTL